MRQSKLLYSLLIIISCFCGNLIKGAEPIHKREFRAVWIATVSNIDWPTSPNDPVEKQQEDFIAILDFYKKLNFNAVIVQVRTAGDAFYPSKLAPWSRFLTGQEGKAPELDYDPMAWMIQEAHNRGFEFHAWLNPYRATFDLNTDILSPQHDFFTHQDWMIPYGKKYYYNPGIPEVQDHLVNIITEVVENYDIDAIHFDDYFYPYKTEGEVFKDADVFVNHAEPGQSLEDWRRENINDLIRKTHESIKKRKPWVHFGISPFGVWRNASIDPLGSDTEAGQTTYDDLYADPLKWMENGWIDYLAPQLYWSMDFHLASYRRLIDWWDKNVINTNLYIGNGAYKVKNNSDTAWYKKEELPNQIALSRATQNISGNIFFSANSLLNKHDSIINELVQNVYNTPILPPSSNTLDTLDTFDDTPEIISKRVIDDTVHFRLKKRDTMSVKWAVLYNVENKRQRQMIKDPKNIIGVFPITSDTDYFNITIPIHFLDHKRLIAVSYLDFYRRESEICIFKNKLN